MKLMKNKIFVLIFSFFLLFILLSGFLSIYVMSVNSAIYSSVMDDLTSDSNFNIEDYPSISNDYSLQIVQLAESINKELFIYLYNPSYESEPLVATSVRLSSAINNSFHPLDYNLILLSRYRGGLKGRWTPSFISLQNVQNNIPESKI